MARRPAADVDDAGTLQAYLREIGRLPRLTAEEEQELGKRIQHDGDEAALKRLVEANLRFVVAYAKRYRGLGVPFLDLIHEGNLGLMEAARRFDPARNVKFITYAVWWIRQSIVRAVSDQSRIFSLPPKLSPIAVRFGERVASLAESLDRAPTLEEIAAELDITTSEAAALMRIGREDLSLDGPAGPTPDSEGRALEETLAQEAVPAADEVLLSEALAASVRAMLEELDPKERHVVSLRFGLEGGEPQTLQQIGNRLGITRERVRQIEARARAKLRRSRRAGDLRHYLD